MHRYNVAIIGSGLGGLECAYTLAKKGMSVCVIEKNNQVGGCLQSFKRWGEEFDTGFHYVGALGKGEILHKLFTHYGIADLPWYQLDKEGFNQVVFRDKSFLLAGGYKNYIECLCSYFPQDREDIVRYVNFLEQVGNNITRPLLKENEGLEANALFARNAHEFMRDSFENQLLRAVVSGSSLKLELNKNTLPLYTFAQINSSYIQSAWRLCGGGSLIADKLVQNIQKEGGVVLTNSKAVEIREEGGNVQSVELENGEKIFADYFISNLNPQSTLGLIKESSFIRPIYRHRIHKLEQTFGMFTVNILLKENKLPYLNRSIYYYTPDLTSPWDIPDATTQGRIKAILINQQVPRSAYPSSPTAAAPVHYARVMDILAPMNYSEVQRWEGTAVGRRGEAYKSFKQKKAEECIRIAENCIPGLKDSIENYITSTPLTYMNYTDTIQGSAYGIRKDCNNLIKTLLTPKTPLQNLFLTGQNLNLHGILGVSITSLLTCSEILGRENVVSFLE